MVPKFCAAPVRRLFWLQIDHQGSRGPEIPRTAFIPSTFSALPPGSDLRQKCLRNSADALIFDYSARADFGVPKFRG